MDHDVQRTRGDADPAASDEWNARLQTARGLVQRYAGALAVIGLLAMALAVVIVGDGGRRAELGWALLVAGGVAFLGSTQLLRGSRS